MVALQRCSSLRAMHLLFFLLFLRVASLLSRIDRNGNQSRATAKTLTPRIFIHDDGEDVCTAAEREQVEDSIQWLRRMVHWVQISVAVTASSIDRPGRALPQMCNPPYPELWNLFRDNFELPLTIRQTARGDVRSYFRAVRDKINQ